MIEEVEINYYELYRRMVGIARGLNIAGQDSTAGGRPKGLPKIDEDEDDDKRVESSQLSLPPIGEKKVQPKITTMCILLPDHDNVPIEKKTPSITLPRISQSYTRRSVQYFQETPIMDAKVDLNVQIKEKQEKQR